MAVEARRLNLFRPQLVGPANRGFGNPIDGEANMYATQMGYGLPLLSAGTTTTTTTTTAPTYNSMIVDSISPVIAIKSDSGLTYNNNNNNNCNLPLPLPRKRSRDCMNMNPMSTHKSCGSFSFLGDDISLQIHQQQLDIDRLISQHLEKVRSEMEEKRRKEARRIMEAIEVGVIKRLKAKEEEMVKIGKLNWALQERVKSLCIENQVWRDMAESNEAAVNELRANLEQVLMCELNHDEMEAEESSCGSNGNGNGNGNGGEELEEDKDSINNNNNGILCRSCRKEESSVLLLPCRHLCVCSQCVSSIHMCPICKSTKNATVQVNMY